MKEQLCLACGSHANSRRHVLPRLMRNEMNAEGTRSLIDTSWPASNTTLTYLSLRDNNLGVNGARDLAEALAVNETLTRLECVGERLSRP